MSEKHTRSCPALTPSDDDCTCGLSWRTKYQTAMTLLEAWQKRAYELEYELEIATAKERANIVEYLKAQGNIGQHQEPYITHEDIASIESGEYMEELKQIRGEK